LIRRVKTTEEKNIEATKILAGAYSLKNPEDHVEYYGRIAKDYDTKFAGNMGYIYPKEIAKKILEIRNEISGKICDIGCGTGLVAECLKNADQTLVIDGVDVSQEMLEVARNKKIYNSLYAVDLTADTYKIPTDYSAIISAGTFTHGHLGPEPIRSLIKYCKNNAQCFIGVNQVHFDEKHFASFLNNMIEEKIIANLSITELTIYLNQESEYRSDKALLCYFEVSC
jgi:2-polyprenyl-3-methyl-5-hydroxy-6-metoxy-1,4-benzoquinol methylase